MWKQKSPAEAGLFFTSAELLGGTDDFDINATIRLQAGNDLGALCALALIRLRDRLLTALALSVNTVGRDALANYVILDGRSALLGKLLVVSRTTDTVSMTDRDNNFQNELVLLRDNFVKLSFAFGAQGGLVEVEQRVSSDGDLLTHRLGRGGRSGRSGGGRNGSLRLANVLRE